MSVSEKILDAIQILAAKTVERAGYDRTIQAQIISCEDQTIGKYKCRYQDAVFYAYSNSAEVTYSQNAYVYVLVPANDMGNQKTILGTTKKLGLNYISEAQGKQAYNIIGTNTVLSDDTYYLRSDLLAPYTYEIYNYQNENNLLDIDIEALYKYLKESSSLIVGSTITTSIDNTRQYRGYYGITFYLRFQDNTINNQQVVRSYTVDEDNMVGNPYKLLYPTQQYSIFDIDGENFLRLDSIQIFSRDFPNANVPIDTLTQEEVEVEEIEDEESRYKLLQGDIQLCNIQICGAKRLDEQELNGVTITFYTPQGTFFTQENQYKAKTITAQVRVKGKITSPQSLDFYWGIENVGIAPSSQNYNKYLGRGWQCLNNKYTIQEETQDQQAIVEWVPSGDTYVLDYEHAAARNNRIKVAVTYENTLLVRQINIQNLISQHQLSIVSSDGNQFYYDMGQPTLTCYIDDQQMLSDQEDTYTYVWAKEDNTGNLVRLPIEKLLNVNNEIVKDNKIQKVQINQITNFAIFKCSVYKNDVYLGTASIVIYNSLDAKDLYTLVINNGSAVFKYNENGVAPNNRSLENPQVIEALTFTIYDNLGNTIESQSLENLGNSSCKIAWTVPVKNTLITDINKNGTGQLDETGKYKVFKDLKTFVYNIATRYNANSTLNEITLTVNYKGYNLTAVTNFSFFKEGQPGTNGTEFIVKIVPNTRMVNPPLYPMITYAANDKNCYLNYGVNATNDQTTLTKNTNGTYTHSNRLFKAQLWQNGELIYDTNTSAAGFGIEWSILKNKYNKNYSDYSAFDITSAGIITYTPKTSSTDLTQANVVKCSITYNGKLYYGTIPVITAYVSTVNRRITLQEYTGFRYVMYTSDGVYPSYDNTNPFEIICKEYTSGSWQNVSLVPGTNAINYNFNVISSIYNIDNKGVGTLFNTENLVIRTNGVDQNKVTVSPSSVYKGQSVNNAVACVLKRGNNIIGFIHIPVHLLLNKYGLANINAWDGNSVQVNSEGGYILAPQMGAGVKDSNNNFTGVLMGQVKTAGKNKSDVGLLGYNQGQRTIFLNSQNGSAIFGTSKTSQLIIDPKSSRALLYSGNFWNNYDPQTGLPTSYTSQGYNKQGLLIDLSTPQILFGNGNFSVNANGYLTAKGGGSVAGWNIANTTLQSANKTITLSSSGNGAIYSNNHTTLANTSNGFYIAADGLSLGKNFSVSADGTIKASAGSFTGKITSKEGEIANWTIGNNYLATKVNNAVSTFGGTTGMYFGASGLRIGQYFSVSSTGQLKAKGNAEFEGKITSKTGNIGGWNIGDNYLYCASGKNKQNLSGKTSDNAIVQIGDNYATNAPYIDQSLQGQIYLGSSGIFYGNKFVVNSNGSLYCTDAHIVGDIYARNGYFAGTVYASGGKFSGELDATSGKFNSLRGTQFTFVSGEIQSDVKISGALDVNGNKVSWRTDDVMIGLTSEKEAPSITISNIVTNINVTKDKDGKVTGCTPEYGSRTGSTSREFIYKLHRKFKTIQYLAMKFDPYTVDDG